MRKFIAVLAAATFLMSAMVSSVTAQESYASNNPSQETLPPAAQDAAIYEEVLLFEKGMSDRELADKLERIPEGNRHIVQKAMDNPNFGKLSTKTVYVELQEDGTEKLLTTGEVAQLLHKENKPNMVSVLGSNSNTYDGLTIGVNTTDCTNDNSCNSGSVTTLVYAYWSWSGWHQHLTDGLGISWGGNQALIYDGARTTFESCPASLLTGQPYLATGVDKSIGYKVPQSAGCLDGTVWATNGYAALTLQQTQYSDLKANVYVVYYHYYMGFNAAFNMYAPGSGSNYVTVSPSTGSWSVATYTDFRY